MWVKSKKELITTLLYRDSRATNFTMNRKKEFIAMQTADDARGFSESINIVFR